MGKRSVAVGRTVRLVRGGDDCAFFCGTTSLGGAGAEGVGYSNAVGRILGRMFGKDKIDCAVGNGRIVLGIRNRSARRTTGRGVVNMIARSTAKSPVPKTSIVVGKAGANAAASMSNGFRIVTASDSILIVSFVKCSSGRVGMKGRGMLDIALSSSTRRLSRMIMATFKAKRGGRAMANSVRSMHPTSLGMPATGLSATFTNHLSNIVSCRHDNRPKGGNTSFFVHNITAVGDTAPLVMLSKIRVSGTSLGTLSPRIVRDFSMLGSTATSTVCNAHNTGNMLVVGAGSNSSLRGPVVNIHMRTCIGAPVGHPGAISKIAFVEVCGRTIAGRNAKSTLCSSSGVCNATGGLGPCVCPGIS